LYFKKENKMLKKYIKYKTLSLLMLCWGYLIHHAQAQLINNGATIVIKDGASISTSSQLENRNNGQITNDGSIIVKGNLNLNAGSITNNKDIVLSGNLLINAILINNPNSAFILVGTTQQIGGNTSLSFWNLNIANRFNITPQKVILDRNISIVNQLNLQDRGYINLNGKFIDLGQRGIVVGENNENRIREEANGGYIQAVNRSDIGNIGGLGITFEGTPPLTGITLRRGHDSFTTQAGQSIKRYFDITPNANATLGQNKLIFRYFNTELSTPGASGLQLSESQDAGNTWKEKQSTVDEDGLFIETTDFDLVSNRNVRWTAFEKNPPLRAIANTPLCEDKLRLEANEIAGATYKWTGPNGFTANGRTPVIDFSTNLQSGIYKVTAQANGSELVGEVNVVIDGISFTAEAKQISCVGGIDGVIRVSSKNLNTMLFTLINSDNNVLSSQSGTSIEFANLPKGEYTLTALNSVGCQKTEKLTITEQSLIPVDAGKDIAILRGSTAQLQATGATTYIWASSSSLDNLNISNPKAKPDVTTTYKVTGRNAQGCESTDEITVFVLETLVVSKVLSPNNDGVNDFWTIEKIEDFPNAEIEVYNRWGQVVFSTKGYQNNWDGTGINGALPDATYYYTIKIEDNKFISGFFSLVR
jgi:gliding motility-associated-like protein